MPSTSHCEQRGQPDCEGAAQDFALAAKHFAFSAEQFVQIMRRGALRGSLLKRPAFPSRNAPRKAALLGGFRREEHESVGGVLQTLLRRI
jgi:hypothetical protein